MRFLFFLPEQLLRACLVEHVSFLPYRPIFLQFGFYSFGIFIIIFFTITNTYTPEMLSIFLLQNRRQFKSKEWCLLLFSCIIMSKSPRKNILSLCELIIDSVGRRVCAKQPNFVRGALLRPLDCVLLPLKWDQRYLAINGNVRGYWWQLLLNEKYHGY